MKRQSSCGSKFALSLKLWVSLLAMAESVVGVKAQSPSGNEWVEFRDYIGYILGLYWDNGK